MPEARWARTSERQVFNSRSVFRFAGRRRSPGARGEVPDALRRGWMMFPAWSFARTLTCACRASGSCRVFGDAHPETYWGMKHQGCSSLSVALYAVSVSLRAAFERLSAEYAFPALCRA